VVKPEPVDYLPGRPDDAAAKVKAIMNRNALIGRQG
jgi:hypothetical protein